jgi:hypothetical protein
MDTEARRESRLFDNVRERDNLTNASSMRRIREQDWYREAESRAFNLHRHQQVDQFADFNKERVSMLSYDQKEAPCSDQLLFPERHALSALFLYHHKTGFEFLDSTNDYMDIRCVVSLCRQLFSC